MIAAWGRLGYPRRARWLWEAAVAVAARRLARRPADLPGVGRYTAAAIAAQVDDADASGIEVNIRRVCERVAGRAAVANARPKLRPRAIGANHCAAATGCSRSWISARRCAPRASPRARACPIARRVRDARRARRARPAPPGRRTRARSGSGAARVMAELRAGRRSPSPSSTPRRSTSLVRDGLAEITGAHAQLPAPVTESASRACGEEVAQQVVARVGEDRLGVELHAFDRELAVAQPHHQAVVGLGRDLEHVGHRIALRRRASGSASR